MKRVKLITSLLLAFLIMILIISSTFLYIINNYINKENLIAKLEEIEIYKQIYDEAQDGFKNYIYQSGLELDTLDKICSEEKIKNDFLAIIDNIYDGKEVNIDTKIIKDNLDKEVKSYITKQGRKLTVEEEENIEKFEDLMANSYGESISSYRTISNLAGEGKVGKIANKITTIRDISIAVTIVLTIVLIILKRKKILSSISYLSMSLFASGIVLVNVKPIILGKIDLDNIVLFTKSISNSFIYIVKEILSNIHSTGIWYICIGLFGILMIAIQCFGEEFPRTKRRN